MVLEAPFQVEKQSDLHQAGGYTGPHPTITRNGNSLFTQHFDLLFPVASTTPDNILYYHEKHETTRTEKGVVPNEIRYERSEQETDRKSDHSR